MDFPCPNAKHNIWQRTKYLSKIQIRLQKEFANCVLTRQFILTDRTRLSHQYSKACTKLHSRHTFTFASLDSYKSCLSGLSESEKAELYVALHYLCTLLRFTAGINNSTLLSEGNLLLMTSWTASLIHTRPNTYLLTCSF